MSRKSCSKCGVEKAMDEFYGTSVGRVAAQCKECAKAAVRANRAKNIDYYRARDVARYKEPIRRAYAMNKAAEQKIRNPVKVAARTAVSNALRDGLLTRQPCDVCGEPDAHAHHDDYNKPLDVRWLCVRHHHDYHTLMKQVAKALIRLREAG